MAAAKTHRSSATVWSICFTQTAQRRGRRVDPKCQHQSPEAFYDPRHGNRLWNCWETSFSHELLKCSWYFGGDWPSISKTCYSQSGLVPHRPSSTHAYSRPKWMEEHLGDQHLKVSATVFSEEPQAGTPAQAAGSTGPCARRLNRIKGEEASPQVRAFSACFLPTVTGAVLHQARAIPHNGLNPLKPWAQI